MERIARARKEAKVARDRKAAKVARTRKAAKAAKGKGGKVYGGKKGRKDYTTGYLSSDASQVTLTLLGSVVAVLMLVQ